MTLYQRPISADRALQVSVLFRHLALVEEFLRVAAHLFLARRHVLSFFTRPKDHRTGAQLGKSKTGDDDEKKRANSEIHGDWQGS